MTLCRIGVLPVLVLSALWIALGPSAAAPPAIAEAEVEAAAALIREPVLQKVSARSATVVWASREPGPAELRYASAGGPFSVVPAATTRYAASYTGMAFDYFQHEANLDGLEPATTYAYDAVVGGVVMTPSSDLLTTAPATGSGTVRFIAFGDSGSGSRQQLELAASMAANSEAGRFDLALHTGDVVYPKGTHQLLHDRFFSVYEPWLRRRPVFLSFGNHEEYANKGQPYFDVFALPENGYGPLFPDHVERYYSFDYGPVHFIALDTQLALGSGARQQEQLTWLVRDLEGTSQPWKIAFFHRPAYGSSEFSSSSDVRRPLRAIFERYGVQLVLAGHEHSYARGVPWREGSEANSAVMHVVTGGGGAGLNTPIPGAWVAAWDGVFHYIRGTVSDCSAGGSCELRLEAVGLGGSTLDAFTLPLREQQSDAAPPVVGWIEPAAGAIVSGVTPVAATVSDDTRIAKVDVWVDGELRMVDTAAPFDWTWDTRSEMNGERRLELRAVDIAGRRTSSTVRVVDVRNAAPTLRLLSPSGRDRAFSDLPFRIRWDAAAGSSPLQTAHVSFSTDGGKTYGPLTDCGGVHPDSGECVWRAPAPATRKAVIRVSVLDAAGRQISAVSRVFEVKSGGTTLAVRNPDKAVTFGIGTTQALSWSSGLGQESRIDIEVSRDGGATWTAIERDALNSRGGSPWVVTGPASDQALIRVRSLGAMLEDVSDTPFSVAPPALSLAGLSPGTVWTRNSTVKVKWKGNLGAYDRLILRLSTDGGVTYPYVLAGSVPGIQPGVAIVVPPVATANARVAISSLDQPAWRAVSPAFTIE